MDNSSVQGTFQEQELQKLQVPEDALYPIEAILKRSGNKLLVKNGSVGQTSLALGRSRKTLRMLRGLKIDYELAIWYFL